MTNLIKITCEEGGEVVGTGSNGYRPRDSEDESCFCHIEYDCFKYERLFGHALKHAPVSAYMRDTLHWLPAPQRFYYRITALVWCCLAGIAPTYLGKLCCTVSALGVVRRFVPLLMVSFWCQV